MERIYFKEARQKLGGVCFRTLLKFIKANGIEIFTVPGTSLKFLLQIEFETALNLLPEKYLQKKYGSSERAVILQAKMKMYSEYREALESRKGTYRPTGKHEIATFILLQSL